MIIYNYTLKKEYGFQHCIRVIRAILYGSETDTSSIVIRAISFKHNNLIPVFAMPTTDGGACVAMVTWSGSSSLVFNFACQLYFVRFQVCKKYIISLTIIIIRAI